MKVDTYMPIVIGDYLKDTMHLACSEHGAYLLLLFHYWTSGPLPDDDRKLAAIARCERSAWPEIREVIAPFFSIADGVWTHKRVEQELLRARAKQARNVERAKAAADARWNATSMPSEHAPSNAPSMPQAMLEQCPPSPSPLDSSETPVPTTPASRVSRLPAVPLPADWQADAGYARQLGLQQAEIDREAIKFRAYWTDGKGGGARKTERGWRQAWMNWIAKVVDRGFVSDGPAPVASAQAPVSDLEAQWSARLSRYRPGGFWPSQWGNRPEQGNRDIPPAALEAWRASHNRGH